MAYESYLNVTAQWAAVITYRSLIRVPPQRKSVNEIRGSEPRSRDPLTVYRLFLVGPDKIQCC